MAPEAWVRQSITDRTVAAVHRGEQIGEREAALLINGGAAFWSEEHLLIGHGFHVRSLIEESEFNAIEIRREIREGGGVARCKFGAIPLRASSGKMAVCVSIWTGFTGDHVFWFYRHEQQFKDEAAANGWLLLDHWGHIYDLAGLTNEGLRFLWGASNTETARKREPPWHLW